MKSKRSGWCNICKATWPAGATIEKFLGKWVHEDCKAVELASRVSDGARTLLPDVTSREGENRKWIRPHVGHTRGIRRVV